MPAARTLLSSPDSRIRQDVCMHQIDTAERRRRLAVRHGLEPRISAGPASVADITRRMVALAATDPATVYLALRARIAGPVTPDEISTALYERRDLVRMLAMRRTVFVVPAESVPVIQASTTDRIATDQRARLLKLLDQAGVGPDAESW